MLIRYLIEPIVFYPFGYHPEVISLRTSNYKFLPSSLYYSSQTQARFIIRLISYSLRKLYLTVSSKYFLSTFNLRINFQNHKSCGAHKILCQSSEHKQETLT